MSTFFTDLDEKGLDALISHVAEAKEHGLALSATGECGDFALQLYG